MEAIVEDKFYEMNQFIFSIQGSDNMFHVFFHMC